MSRRQRYSHPVEIGDRMRQVVTSFAEYDRVKNAAHMYARRRGQRFATERRGSTVYVRRVA